MRMMETSILYLAISLESSVERRRRLTEAACAANIDLVLVSAVTGADVGRMSLGFDRRRRRREFASDLLPTELACLESHLRCLRIFLESSCSHCLVVEDDACFGAEMPLVVRSLVQSVAGWDFIKLWTPGANWPLGRIYCAGGERQVVYPKNLSRDALAILYSREGARSVLKHMERYWMAFDTQLGYICCRYGVVGIGVAPSVCSPMADAPSSIDAGGRRAMSVRPSWRQRLFHRWQRVVNSWRKRRLFRVVRRGVRLLDADGSR